MPKLIQLKDKDGNVYPQLYDSGWIPLNLNTTNFNPTDTSFPLRQRKIGNVVYLEGLASCKVSGIDIELGTVEYKPSNKLYLPMSTSKNEDLSGNKAGVLTIDVDGKIRTNGTSVYQMWVSLGGISYVVDKNN